jgi:hypothetical protein
VESDALSQDSAPATDGRHGGGCAAGPSRTGSPAPTGLVLGIMALIVLRFVYTTARE